MRAVALAVLVGLGVVVALFWGVKAAVAYASLAALLVVANLRLVGLR